jgi:hypothetical protein
MLDEPSARVPDPWTDAMRRGDFEAAWRVSDAVLAARVAAGEPCWHWPRHKQFVWTGGDLAGRRVLVRCYHGLGDTIQFIRFARPLSRIAGGVVVWAQPALIPLLRSTDGVDALLPLHDGTPEVAYDVDVEVMEIPHALRTTLGTLPCRMPYLSVDPAVVAAKRSFVRRPGRLAVGIVWSAGGWDERRSAPLALVERLARVSSVDLWCLQRGPALAEAHERGQAGLFRNPDDCSEDVIETAATMRALDLVVTVDTMAAHLAGALGVPVWTLLHADPDWRWMSGREDSPWYPTMRLFRQAAPGEWAPVLARVEAELRARAGG